MKKYMVFMCIIGSVLIFSGLACSSTSGARVPPPESREKAQPQRHETDPNADASGRDSATAGTEAVAEERIDAFARANTEINRLRQEYAPRFEAAQSEGDRSALQRQLHRETVEAIERHGMTVREFESIGRATETDTELREKVHRKIRQAASEEPPQAPPEAPSAGGSAPPGQAPPEAPSAGSAPPGNEPAPSGSPGGDEGRAEVFAHTYIEIMGLRDEYSPKIRDAQSEDEQQTLMDQLNRQVIKAIEKNGLTVDEYEEISRALADDEALRGRIQKKVFELQEQQERKEGQ